MAQPLSSDLSRSPTVADAVVDKQPPEAEQQPLATSSGEHSARGYNVATRRFLSLCMEDIEPVMEMRGKDAMYQCCYCAKWCTMSGTRALSKHIENEHRPQVIVQMLTFLDCLRVKAAPGQSQTVYIAFQPLDHWNVNLEATIVCEGSHQWATLLPIHEMTGAAPSVRGRPSVHLKMASAKPYLPRPTWSDAQHARQRVGVRICEDLDDLDNHGGEADRSPSGFAVRVEAPGTLPGRLEAEISLSLKVHGKEAALVLPLQVAPEDVITQRFEATNFSAARPTTAERGMATLAQHLQTLKRDVSEDAGEAGAVKRAKVGGGDGAGMGQLSLMAQQLAATQLAAQHLSMRMGGVSNPLLSYIPLPPPSMLPMDPAALGPAALSLPPHHQQHPPQPSAVPGVAPLLERPADPSGTPLR